MKPEDISSHIITTGFTIRYDELPNYSVVAYAARNEEAPVVREAREHRDHVITLRHPCRGVMVFWCLTDDSEVLILQ